jgi:hypothetical protein
MKNKYFLTFLILGGFVLGLNCKTPHLMIAKDKNLFGGKLRFAFFDFKDSPSFRGSGKIVSEALTRSSLKMKNWQTIERKIIDKVLKEKKINLASGIGMNDLREINRILGADYFITGTVTEWKIKETFLEFHFTFAFQYRIVSIKDGTIKMVGTFQSVNQDDKRGFMAAALKESDPQKMCVGLIFGAIMDTIHYFAADSDTYKDEMDFLNIAGNKWINEIGDELNIPLFNE